MENKSYITTFEAHTSGFKNCQFIWMFHKTLMCFFSLERKQENLSLAPANFHGLETVQPPDNWKLTVLEPPKTMSLLWNRTEEKTKNTNMLT